MKILAILVGFILSFGFVQSFMCLLDASRFAEHDAAGVGLGICGIGLVFVYSTWEAWRRK